MNGTWLPSNKAKQTFCEVCPPPPKKTKKTPKNQQQQQHTHTHTQTACNAENVSMSWRHDIFQVYFTGNNLVWQLTQYPHSNRDDKHVKVWSPEKNKFTQTHDFPTIIRSPTEPYPYCVRRIAWFIHVFNEFMWHPGFCSLKCTPLQRGYDSFLGFFNAMGDYTIHTSFGKNAWAHGIFPLFFINSCSLNNQYNTRCHSPFWCYSNTVWSLCWIIW